MTVLDDGVKEQRTLKAARVPINLWAKVRDCFKVKTGLISIGPQQVIEQLFHDFVAECEVEQGQVGDIEVDLEDAARRGEYG